MNVYRNLIAALSLAVVLLPGCDLDKPNQGETGESVFEEFTSEEEGSDLFYHETVYIPIYSDIYTESKHVKFNLTATLSIRNTSFEDTIYIETIDYYDSHGRLVREYLDDRNLQLGPMQSIEYVIEEDDTEGGTGANFIIYWGARNPDVEPVFQGVMISTHGQQGISFITEGKVIEGRE